MIDIFFQRLHDILFSGSSGFERGTTSVKKKKQD